MGIIETAVDTGSDAYRENREAMLKLVEELGRELKTAREERSDRARKRNAELGKLSVQQRLDRLLDPDSPWLEIAPLAASGMYEGDVHGAGSRAGIGVIHGREVVVLANDPMIKGGTVYPMGTAQLFWVYTV